MDVELKQRGDGVVFRINARAGAAKDEIRGVHDGALKVAVTQAPEKGKANTAIVNLLARRLKIPKGRISIVVGAQSTNKWILVAQVNEAQLAERLVQLFTDK